MISIESLPIKAKLFRGFADPSRFSVLEVLRNGPRSVTDVMEATGLSQSNTSNHLSCLYDCGLVQRSHQGRRVYYQLSDPRVGELLTLIDTLLDEVAQGVESCGQCTLPAETKQKSDTP